MSRTALKAAVQGLARPSRRGLMGATRYIADVLKPKATWRVNTSARKTKSTAGKRVAQNGLRIGSRTDGQLHALYSGKRTGLSDKRATWIYRHIRDTLKLTPVVSQFPVTLPEHRIALQTDLIAVSDTHIYVLEFKCSQFGMADKLATYDEPCIGHGTLLNHLPNTEAVHHLLQGAIGVMGLRRVLPTLPIKGRIILATDDGVKSFDCERYCDMKHFCVPIPRSLVPKKIDQKVVMTTLPENDSDRKRCLATILDMPRYDIITAIKTKLTVVCRGATDMVAVAMVSAPNLVIGEVKQKKLRAVIRAEIVRLQKDFPSVKVQGGILKHCGILKEYKWQRTVALKR
jgi:hypothetical protein